MPVAFDRRRFRTTVDLVIPAGTLVVPCPDGVRGELNDGTPDPILATIPLEEAERLGSIRQLAEGEA